MKMLHKLWQEDYGAKWEAFENELFLLFPYLRLKTDSQWYCFNERHLSKADENGVLESFKETVRTLVTAKPYEEFFPEFHLEIDYRYIQSEADKLMQVLLQHYQEQEGELIKKPKRAKGQIIYSRLCSKRDSKT